MRIAPVLLATGVAERRVARWRAITGADELALYGRDYAGAIEAIAAILVPGEAAIGADDLARLTLDDGDRLFAALQRALFGPLAEMRQRCGACGDGFELSLAVDRLTGVIPTVREALLPGGTRLRGLLVGDLLVAEDGGPPDLVARATLERGSDEDSAVATALERLTPAMVETVETACPHCHAGQRVAFDLSRFFLACAARERPVLLREVHLLARSYGWGLGEILGLDRGARHELVRLAAASAAPRPRARAA